jgi:L-fuconolactonase
VRRIDAHQHFWQFRPADYPWIGERMGVLRRDFTPADLAPSLVAHGLEGSVAVQASCTPGETDWLLALADEAPSIVGVVGWVDLCAPTARASLEHLAAHPRCRGVRHIVQDEPDDRFLLRADFLAGVSHLAPLGLTYDILVHPRQLPAAVEFARRHPETRLVLDHLGKPPIREGLLEPWARQIRELARLEHVCCKVSGLVTEADWTSWTRRDIAPYLDLVFDVFGASRLMFGSDWPVCLLAAGYDEVIGIVDEYVERLSASEREAVFGGTAARFYGLERSAA